MGKIFGLKRLENMRVGIIGEGYGGVYGLGFLIMSCQFEFSS
jgi:hypothetical protein